MTKEAYPALFHFIHRAMADVTYPVRREQVLALAGDREIHVDWETTVPLRELMKNVRAEEFSCACDFYCKLIASLG